MELLRERLAACRTPSFCYFARTVYGFEGEACEPERCDDQQRLGLPGQAEEGGQDHQAGRR